MENKETTTGKKEYFISDCTPTVYAGCYQIGDDNYNIEFCLQEKPNWLHRKFCQLLLGWKWIDSK